MAIYAKDVNIFALCRTFHFVKALQSLVGRVGLIIAPYTREDGDAYET